MGCNTSSTVAVQQQQQPPAAAAGQAPTKAPAPAPAPAPAAGDAAKSNGDDLFATEKASEGVSAGGSRMCTCYCCGQGYGTASLAKHMGVCPTKREANYRDVPAHLRPPMPKPITWPTPTDASSQAEINAYNAEAMRIYAAHKCACPKCGRLFEPGPFMVHLRAEKIDPNDTSVKSHTKPKPVASSSAAAPAASAAGGLQQKPDGALVFTPVPQRLVTATPETVKAATTIQAAFRGHVARKESGTTMCVCYCCGRQYSYRDLPRHWESCPTKRAANIAAENLPPQVLRPNPKPPLTPVPNPQTSTPADWSKYNAEAQAIYKNAMPQCLYCPRTFEPDRIMPHLRGCSARPKG